MIIDFYKNYGGGGSGSGVTPADVQSAITTALEPYWDSAATEDAISAATAGKADKSNVTPNTNAMQFPLWNGDGVITGTSGTNVYNRSVIINGNKKSILRNENSDLTPIFAPQTVGTPGYQVVAKSDGTAGWDNPLSAYTPTTDFATINGSAITNGGNLIIEAGDVQALQDQVDEIEEVVADALVDINSRMVSSTYVSDIWKGTQAEFDVQTQSGATADPNTFYIIVNN